MFTETSDLQNLLQKHFFQHTLINVFAVLINFRFFFLIKMYYTFDKFYVKNIAEFDTGHIH